MVPVLRQIEFFDPLTVIKQMSDVNYIVSVT